MHRVAIISDIHGNLPALEAVLRDIEKRDIMKIICLGDIIGKGPSPHIALDVVRSACTDVVLGNWEAGLLLPEEEADPRFREVIDWNRRLLGPERMSYLASLPYSLQLSLSGRLVRLFHSSAKGIFHRVFFRSPEEEHHAMFMNTPFTTTLSGEPVPDIVVYADIHRAFMQNFAGKTLINVGSVGNPLEISQACYAILEGVLDCATAASWSAQLVRVPYDIDLAVSQAEAANVPELADYVSELRTARYRGF